MNLQSAWRLVSALSDAARRREAASFLCGESGPAFTTVVTEHDAATKAVLAALTGIPADQLEYVDSQFGYIARTNDGDELLAAMAHAWDVPHAECDSIPSVVTRSPVVFDLHLIDELAA